MTGDGLGLFPIWGTSVLPPKLSGDRTRGKNMAGAPLPALLAFLKFSGAGLFGMPGGAVTPVSSIEVKHALLHDGLPDIARRIAQASVSC